MSSSSYTTVAGAPNLAVVNAVTQFVGGTQAVWNNITLPIPAGLVVYALDTTALKMGDGVTLYANLPVLLYLNAIPGLLTQLATLSGEITALPTSAAMTTAIATVISTALQNSPAFAGTPTAPTPAATDASPKLATTQFVATAIAALALEVAAGITPAQLTADINASLTNYVTTTALATALGRFRIPLTAPTTFYINTTTGSDSTGNGTQTLPWATLGQADIMLATAYDLAGYTATYNYNGATLVTQTSLPSRLYSFNETSAPIASDISLSVGEKINIGFSGSGNVALCVASVPGIYKVTLVVTATNSTDVEIAFKPNNANYTGAFTLYTTEVNDSNLSSVGTATTQPGFVASTVSPYVGQIPTAVVRTGLSNFFLDTFDGPSSSDPTNSRGPFIMEVLCVTTTAAKMLKYSSTIKGGCAIGGGYWTDSVTPWSSLGTFSDAAATSMTGTAIVERIA